MLNNKLLTAIYSIIICFFILFSFGCKSNIRTRDFKKSTLYGMIYDYDNKPSFGALVIVDGKDTIHSDISGRFILVDLTKGTHEITIRLDNYEELNISFDFLDKSDILYLKLISFNQLLRLAEVALEEKKFTELENYLVRAEAIKADNPIALYLRSIYYLHLDNIDDAIAILQRIIETGYNEPVIYLALADIYQYKLEDIPLAISQLEKYLLFGDNPEVKQRLNVLNSM